MCTGIVVKLRQDDLQGNGSYFLSCGRDDERMHNRSRDPGERREMRSSF